MKNLRCVFSCREVTSHDLPLDLDLSIMTLAELERLRPLAPAAICTTGQHRRFFGEGSASARLILLGEQPGDREYLEGEPFVGPAGRELNRALEEAGIDRSKVYVTNVVKHRRFEERGKKRLHKKLTRAHIEVCRPWLDAELERVDPSGIVCLVGSAAQALLGSRIRVTEDRGVPVEWNDYFVMPTFHPSFILRILRIRAKVRAINLLVSDAQEAARLAASL